MENSGQVDYFAQIIASKWDLFNSNNNNNNKYYNILNPVLLDSYCLINYKNKNSGQSVNLTDIIISYENSNNNTLICGCGQYSLQQSYLNISQLSNSDIFPKSIDTLCDGQSSCDSAIFELTSSTTTTRYECITVHCGAYGACSSSSIIILLFLIWF